MGKIGEFQRNGDSFEGRIQTLSIDKNVSIEPAGEKSNDKAPDYRCFAVSDKDGFKNEIGAGWVKESGKGNNYMAVSIDTPDLPKPLNGALFEKDDGKADLVWDRPKEQGKAQEKAEAVKQRSM